MKKKICIICGDEFENSTNRKFCYKDHWLGCPYCGTMVQWNTTQEFHGCKKCIYQNSANRRKKTMLKKYGAETTLQSQELRNKMESTMLEKYGTKNALQNGVLRDKIRADFIEKYGVENPMQNPEIARRSGETRKQNMDEIVEHIKQSFREKYGVDNISELPETMDKITDTFMRKYGARRAIQIPEFRQKMIDTMIERYGVPYYVMLDSANLQKVGKVNQSFAALLETRKIRYEMGYRIESYYFDFYLPDYNTLIEIDPTYTHNVVGNHFDSTIDADYHKKKSSIAETNGFRCIHIFDWDSYSDVLNLLDKSKTVYARKLQIREVSKKDADEFLLLYHIQGTCRGQSIRLGLYDDDELLELITFGRARYNKKYEYELLRLCTKTGYNVVGGASKLFKHAVDDYGLNNIISYCDNAKFRGDVYEKIGMRLLRSTPPQEIWSKGSEKVTANLLRQHGYDKLFGTNYGKGSSNDKLMIENGWLPVYDCGQSVYVYYKEDDIIGDDNENDDRDELPQPDKIEDMKSFLKSVKKTLPPKKCDSCGKEFIPKVSWQRYCDGPHYRLCPVCRRQYEEKNNDFLKLPVHACSNECRRFSIYKSKNIKFLERLIEEFGYSIQLDLLIGDFTYDLFIPSTNILIRFATPNFSNNTENLKYLENAKEHRYRLITIFPGDDIRKIVKSVMKPNLLDSSDFEVFYLKENVTKKFLKENCIDPIDYDFKLSIGLIKGNEIYQCITFGVVKDIGVEGHFQLYNVCTKLGYSLKGGLDRLSYEASRFGLYDIVAVSDRSKPTQSYYLEMGMKEAKVESPKVFDNDIIKLYDCGRIIYKS